MHERYASIPLVAGDDLSALLSTLHDTVQRLEELSGHQVDAVLENTFVQLLAAEAQQTGRNVALQTSILDALPELVALMDIHGVILSTNLAWRSGGGHALQGPGCEVGADYLRICDSAAGENALAAGNFATGLRTVLSGQVHSFAMEYCFATGAAQRCFLLTAFPLPGDSPEGFVVMHVDVTDRRCTELALQRQQTQLRTLIDALPAMIWFKDTENRILRINQQVAQACGLAIEKIEGRPTIEIYPQFAAGHFADDLQVMKSGLARIGIVERVPDAAGEDRWIETDKVPVRDKQGKVVGICVVSHDVSEQRRVESALRESERRFSELLDNVDLAAVMLDRAGRITYCNDHLLRLTGWQLEEVIGMDWFEVFMPGDLGDMRPVFQALLANLPEARHRENEISTRGGDRRLIRWSNSVLRAGSGAVVGTASIGEDVTEQRLAEVRIKRLNRVYAVLSGINSLIVRVHDRDELFREACHIAVKQGQFKMAWIGIVNKEAATIVPVAAEGADLEFIKLVEGRAAQSDSIPLAGDTLTAHAVRYNKAMVTNEIAGDATRVLAKERLDRGIASMAILPLLVGGKAAGVMVLYAEESNFFDEDEMKLLTNLCGDIGFAIDHIEKKEQLDYLTYHDVLTGLPNRRLFLQRVAPFVRSSILTRRTLALCVIDLQGFRNINDTLGRAGGDDILRQVGAWLTQHVPDATLLARVGADQFALALPESSSEGEVRRRIEASMAAFVARQFKFKTALVHVAARVGVSLCPTDGVDADTLFRNAEVALRKAKVSGNRYMLFEQWMTASVSGKLTLENRLRNALRDEEFVLHYQPKVDLASGAIVGVEALMRWNDPRKGLVPPGQFIPVLEETGLILEVGEWALRRAVHDHQQWRERGLPAVRIAVNVSPLQLRRRDFTQMLASALAGATHREEVLELEITESLVMENIAHSISCLQAIRAMGVPVAIDDFGTGFSSLSYLAKLPIDTLKVDGSFIADMTSGPKGLALVSTIIGLGHALQLKVVAECVETDNQARLLRLLKCDEIQGFLHSRPMPADQLEADYLAAIAGGTMSGNRTVN